MEELKSAVEDQFNQMADRFNIRPAYDNLIGFFHAIDWKGLLAFHLILFFAIIFSRRNINFHMFLFFLARKITDPIILLSRKH